MVLVWLTQWKPAMWREKLSILPILIFDVTTNFFANRKYLKLVNSRYTEQFTRLSFNY
jgi:hypothetical protein